MQPQPKRIARVAKLFTCNHGIDSFAIIANFIHTRNHGLKVLQKKTFKTF